MRNNCIIIILLLTLGCKNFITNESNLDSTKVRLINKAPFCFSGKEFKVLNNIESQKIIQLFTQSTPISKPINVRLNSGFVEITDQKEFTFFVIFSDIDGTIIRHEKKYFNNKELISKIMLLLDLRRKKGASEECDRFFLQ